MSQPGFLPLGFAGTFISLAIDTLTVYSRPIRGENWMKIGIAAYLDDLAHRYAELARQCPDQGAAYRLQGISIELSSKAHELAQTFVVKPSGRGS